MTTGQGNSGGHGGSGHGAKPFTLWYLYKNTGGGGVLVSGGNPTTGSTSGAGGVGLQVNIDGNNYYCKLWNGGGGMDTSKNVGDGRNSAAVVVLVCIMVNIMAAVVLVVVLH